MDDPATRSGQWLDKRFELERQVASGGMGRVFLARDHLTDQPVAVKLLARPDNRAAERFLYEAVVLAEIQHPGIVRYVAHGTTDAGAPYLAMEWLEGEDLSNYLRRQRRERSSPSTPLPEPTPPSSPAAGSSPSQTESTVVLGDATFNDGAALYASLAEHAPQLPVPQVLQLGRRLSSAVAELHRRGIVHRDIKPANLFLRGGHLDQVKLLDFGTVRRHMVQERMTEPGRLIGTPHYMAPEQARSGGDIGPATDVWAMGCVLYECLTGIKAFAGKDLLAVLTCIILEDPIPIAQLRSDVPAPLSELVAKMLSKTPGERPDNADTLADALAAMSAACARADTARETSLNDTLPSAIAITAAEARVTCVLFASDGSRRAATVPGDEDAALIEAAASAGGELQRLANGTMLVTVPGPRLPTDQAARAARAALALRQTAPSLSMVLATGRAEGPRQLPLGHVVSKAGRVLERRAPGRIHLDELAAALLDSRFHLKRDSHGSYLHSERQYEATRTLLGRPTRWVGRQRELASLMATFDECVHEEVAHAVLVTAPAGMGKSRLRYEFEQHLRQNYDKFEVLRGQGDVVGAGSPFVMIAPAIRRLAGILEGEPLAVRQRKLHGRLAETVPQVELERVVMFLGELTGVPFPEHLHPSLPLARKDPLLLGRLMEEAWLDWLLAECNHRPVLLLLEDLHWGDLPSIRFIESALRKLTDRPFMVMALARPEIHTVFPRLWPRADTYELPLRALSRKASTSLVRDVLGHDIAEHVVEAVVERAGGNAFYLEELIRAVSEHGADHLPDSILGMVQNRLDVLGTEAKQILRASSIFGHVFWQGGVEALLGPHGAYEVSEWLDELVAREVISRQPEARIPGEVEYKFRHSLVRDGAYALLTEEDLRLGHALAGTWLEQAGEQDGLTLAEHFMRGGDPERAIPYFLRAGAQALEGNDLAAVMSSAERAIAAGASGLDLGALRNLQAVASYWLSNYQASQQHGLQALEILPAGDGEWFSAVGTAIVSSARIGDYATLDDLLARAQDTNCDADTLAKQILCLCRGTFQLVFSSRFAQADELLETITALVAQAGDLDPLTRAQVRHVQGLRAAHTGDPGTCLGHLQAVVAAFEEAGDTRNVALERTTVAWCWAELGYFDHAAALGERNMEFCRQSGIQQAITYGKVNLGYILSYCEGRLPDARRLLLESIEECRQVGNPRLEGWAQGHLTWVNHQAGAHEAAERGAARAVELLPKSPGLQAWTMAARARALLALGQPQPAIQHAREAMRLLDQLGGLLQGESLPPLVLAQALHASGDHEAAIMAIRDAAVRLHRRAGRLPEPAWRTHFLAMPQNALTLQLAAAWAG
ncbi:serine/threonine-protein kinase PknK [Haliangium ochraceum]|uniref:Serine/threonine protein kinase n=1 Tax=Haliangium ochraceum (strain DSM 14365 / JCM 11303 / SMP-2) TaxID=502025 RepID=D0LZ14_HALO1|nr:serine/threonine-protein kinase [Haliangium ochraceum]ACY14484.1 serine/threonine protein kinase [Haliangium ochraceum DSM 14365]